MIDVKRPVLLDANLDPVRVLEPQNVAITLNSPGISQATITLGPEDPEPPMHAWAEIYNQHGSVGIFRVAVPSRDYTQQQSVTLRHGIDSLADSHWIGQEEFEGTVTQLLTRMLSYQTARVKGEKPWQLGTCQCTAQKKLSINYDRLSDLLAKIEEEEINYYFSYDQTTFPWTIHFLEKTTEADSEFRLNRNVRTISKSESDSEMCTQLILSVNVTQTITQDYTVPGSGQTPSRTETTGDVTETETVIRTYDNLEAQAIYGIIQLTADIDTHDNISGGSFPEADAWAARFLAQHSVPTHQIQIEGDELFRLTNDTWDETRLAHICRVELPKYNTSVAHRAVSITYPEALSDPAHVTVSLATQLPKFSSSIASLKKAEAATAKAARGVGRSAAKAKELTHWSMVVTDQQDALDGTGILDLHESGIDMDAHGGVKIYNLAQGLQSLYSGIELQAGRIDLVVQGEGNQASIKIQAIVDGINGSQIDINADRIALNGSTSIADVMEISSGGGLLVKRIAIFGNSGNLVTINNGKVSAETVQINSSGALTFGDGTGYGYRSINATTAGNLVTGFGQSSESGGQITIPYYTVGIPAGSGASAGSINFNIAATQYYIDGVAAAETAGQDSVNVVMGSWSNGRVTFSPSVGAGGSKTLKLSNVSGPNTITSNGNYTYQVMYEDDNGDDRETGLTKTITVDAAVPIQTKRYVTYTSNGTRTVTPSSGYDAMAAVEVTVDVPQPAYSASGWGITAAAGGGTKVELYVDGKHFAHTFNNYP